MSSNHKLRISPFGLSVQHQQPVCKEPLAIEVPKNEPAADTAAREQRRARPLRPMGELSRRGRVPTRPPSDELQRVLDSLQDGDFDVDGRIVFH